LLPDDCNLDSKSTRDLTRSRYIFILYEDMNDRQSNKTPPLIAKLLLSVFGCSMQNDALLGDLEERYRHKRSAQWYWTQTVSAIFHAFWNDVQRRPLTVLRAVLAGWLVYWPLGYVVFHFGLYQLALDSFQLDSPDLLIGSWTPPIWYHTARFGQIYTFAADGIATVALVAIAVFAGWIVALLFSSQTRSALFVFSITVLASWIWYNASVGDTLAGARLP
jgi:hypothetical protein